MKFGNIILDIEGEPIFVDLERALPIARLPRFLAAHACELDLQKFRDHFGTGASNDRAIPSLREHGSDDSGRNERRKRVLFVINSLTGGGAERVMTTLLTNSKDRLRRYEIALAVLDDVPRAFEMPDWLRIFQLDCKGGILSSIRSLDQVVRDYEPDITLSFLTRANFASCIAMMKRRLPRIISERTSTPAHLGGALRQASDETVDARALSSRDPRHRGFIGCCRQDLRRLRRAIECDRGHSQTRSTSKPCERAADRAGRPQRIEAPYIVAVGRLVSVKNYCFAHSRVRCSGPSLPACDRRRRAGAQTAPGARCKARRRRSRDHAGMASQPLSAGQQSEPVCAQLRHRGLSECACRGARLGRSCGSYELQGRPGGDSCRQQAQTRSRDFRSRKPAS